MHQFGKRPLIWSSMDLSTVASDLNDEVRFLSIGIPPRIENMCNKYGKKECNGSKQLQRVRKCLFYQKKKIIQSVQC